MAFETSTGDRIGIIGGGHLGRALACALIGRGFPQDRILISYGGSPETRRGIVQDGLERSLATNETICQNATIVFITVRPQSVASLRGLPFRKTTLNVSCMAGVPAGLLEEILGTPAIRMMPSGPETLLGYDGVVGIYPDNESLSVLLTLLGQEVFVMHDEDELNVFTAGVCLPSAILVARALGVDPESGMGQVIGEFPIVARMYEWAKKAVPQSLSPSEEEEYVRRMSTRGGITEAIVTRIRAGESIREAFHAGIERSRAISREITSTLSG